jgi:hypothetical protein
LQSTTIAPTQFGQFVDSLATFFTGASSIVFHGALQKPITEGAGLLAPISTAIDGIGKAPIQLKNPAHLRTSIHQPTKIGAYIGPGRPLSEVDLVIVPIMT